MLFLLCWHPRRRRKALCQAYFTDISDAKNVAQVSNLLYRGFPTGSRPRRFEHPANWKLAIQQVGNLRYDGRAWARRFFTSEFQLK